MAFLRLGSQVCDGVRRPQQAYWSHTASPSLPGEGSGKGALGPLPQAQNRYGICSGEIMYRHLFHPFPQDSDGSPDLGL